MSSILEEVSKTLSEAGNYSLEKTSEKMTYKVIDSASKKQLGFVAFFGYSTYSGDSSSKGQGWAYKILGKGSKDSAKENEGEWKGRLITKELAAKELMKSVLTEETTSKDPIKDMKQLSKKLGIGSYDGRSGIVFSSDTELRNAQRKLEDEMDYKLRSYGRESFVYEKKNKPSLLISVGSSGKALLTFY